MARLRQCYSFLWALGLVNRCSKPAALTINGKRKVVEAIEALCTDKRLKHPRNETLFRNLLQYKQSLAKEVPTTRKPAAGSKLIDDYTLSHERISQVRGTPRSSHKTQKLSKDDKNYIFKQDPTGRQINEFATFSGLCYRLLLNDSFPEIASAYNASGRRVGILSAEIPNLRTLHEHYLSKKFTLTQAEILQAGVGRILAAAYCEEENDLHGGNIGYDPELKKFYLFDSDQTNWPLVSKYRGKNPLDFDPKLGTKPADSFPISQYDLNHLPFLKDAKPVHYPDRTDHKCLPLAFINTIPKFEADVFTILIKRILFNEIHYTALAKLTIKNQQRRAEAVQHKLARGRLIRAALLKNKRVLAFIGQTEGLWQELEAEFESYNSLPQTEETGLLDLKILETEFEDLRTECRYLATREQLAEQILVQLIGKIENLQGQVGIFGGERFVYKDRQIILPKHAAAMLYSYHKAVKDETPPSEALAILVKKARAIKEQQFSFFNRRQEATQLCYEEIAAIQPLETSIELQLLAQPKKA